MQQNKQDSLFRIYESDLDESVHEFEEVFVRKAFLFISMHRLFQNLFLPGVVLSSTNDAITKCKLETFSFFQLTLSPTWGEQRHVCDEGLTNQQS